MYVRTVCYLCYPGYPCYPCYPCVSVRIRAYPTHEALKIAEDRSDAARGVVRSSLCRSTLSPQATGDAGHSVAVTASGRVYCLGDGRAGALGAGLDLSADPLPVALPGGDPRRGEAWG